MKKKGVNRTDQRRDTIKSHLVAEHRHDPYKARGKLAEPSVCPQCTAAFANGRWQWLDERPDGAEEVVCPACRRINDNYPAGEMTLRGGFLETHDAEIISLIRHTENAEKRQHALQRIMAISERDNSVVVTTTDIHLARRIGHAIVSAYKGHLDTHYDEGGYFVRMTWRRDA